MENVQAVVKMVKALSPQFAVKEIQVGPEASWNRVDWRTWAG